LPNGQFSHIPTRLNRRKLATAPQRPSFPIDRLTAELHGRAPNNAICT